MVFISLLALATVAAAQNTPNKPCLDTNFPSCDTVQLTTPEPLALFRVPEPPVVPKWTAFVKSLSDESTYPWINASPMPGSAAAGSPDGGATPGGPNAKGGAWGTPQNEATEVYACPANKWALTFDDGPVLTDQSMAILKENGVVGTYFLIGSNVVNNETHAKFVKDMYDAGHQIALHTWTHRQVSLQSTDQVISEIIFNILAIYKVIKKVPRYFRPPYSAIDDRVRFILKSMGLRPVIWNIESLDAEIGSNAPGGIEITGPLTVDNVVAHVKNNFQQKYDARWDYFPGTGTVGGKATYDGFISLEHDISDPDIQVARQVVAFAKGTEYKSVYVNECDQIMPNASFYLEDESVLAQFIAGIKLPLTADDLAAFTGSFPPIPAGGASVNGTVSTAAPTTTRGATSTGGAGSVVSTTTKSGSMRAMVAGVPALILGALLL